MMKQLADDMRYFMVNKVYLIIIILAAAGAYGFQVSHAAVGIDDTAIGLYFEEGLAPVMGRWTLFVINKLFHISHFSPWITDLAGVFFLLLAGLLWCVLLYRLFGMEVPLLGYTFFAAFFVTCPLISEVYVYYLHNGIGLGYVLSALSLLLIQNVLKKNANAKACCLSLLGAALLMVTAIGCYESFVIVYVIGALFLFIARRVGGTASWAENYCRSVWKWGSFFGIPLLAAVLLRGFLVKLICVVFQLSIPDNFIFGEYRDALSLYAGDITELAMYIKRFWVKYYLNGFVYLPITVLMFGIIILLILCIIYGIKRKDFFLPFAAVVIPVLPVLMILVEGKEPYYRSGQYIPLVGAFSLLLLFRAGQNFLPFWGKCAGVLLATALLWNQCVDMNRWFYVDYLKYEYFKDVMLTVAKDLGRDYDLSKPVIFGGACEVPYTITEDAYVAFDSLQYMIIRKLGDLVDEHLIEKYNAGNGRGYIFAETPVFSTLQWGMTAFDGTAREIKNFLSMIGYEIRIETNLLKIEDASQLRSNMPHFPQKGYIQEYEDYIIVNF